MHLLKSARHPSSLGMKHIARKRFGQHFLTDGAIIEAIVHAIAPRPGQRMVEIGPGLAALTQPLVERMGHLGHRTGPGSGPTFAGPRATDGD